MRRYIFPLFAAILVFLSSLFLLNKIQGKAAKITVELEAIVPKDDKFIVFYLQKGKKQLAGKESVIVPVKGSNEVQTIKFLLPTDKHLIKLRLDVGVNKEEDPIEIKSLKFTARRHSIEKAIDTFFIPNQYLSYNNGKYNRSSLPDGSYNPFFRSRFNVYGLYEELMKPQSIIPDSTQYLLAFIFFFAVFLSLYFANIKTEKLGSVIYILLFFVILWTPTIVKQFDLEPKVVINEKRKLATKPVFSLEKDYPQKFEQYYNDNFGMRSNVINWASRLKLSLFRSSPKPKTVQFGDDGFLFLVAGFSKSKLFTPKQLKTVFQRQKTLRDTLANRGIKYLLGFCPNKHTIYKDKLPFAMKMQVKNDSSIADQIVPYFRERNFDLLDFREDMLQAKTERQLYQKFDTHWNSDGAFAAYQSFCKQTKSELGFKAFDRKDFDIAYKEKRKGDLIFMLGMPENPYYHDELPEYTLKDASKNYKIIKADKSFPKRTIITVNENCDNDQVALVFRDSYGAHIVPFLSLHFRKVVYIFIFKPNNIYYKPELLAKVNPNIVLSFSVERFIPLLLK